MNALDVPDRTTKESTREDVRNVSECEGEGQEVNLYLLCIYL